MFRQFSFPGDVPSHTAPETPGSIHEGGELGYSLSHAYGAAFDNPARDGAVLPILHLNGYKIANPAVLARISSKELLDLLGGYGYTPYLVEGSDPSAVHQAMAATLDKIIGDIKAIQTKARGGGKVVRPRWPMIVLRTPKG